MVRGSERSLTSGWNTILRVSVGSSSDNCLSLLLDTSWVACRWYNIWDIGAGNVIGDTVGDGRDRGSWDSKKLADVDIVDEAEEEGLAAGISSALGQTEGCRSCEREF